MSSLPTRSGIENNHTLSRDDKKRRANLALKAGRYNIATTKKVMTNVTETWVGKPKGKLQVAWERGLLNLDKYKVSLRTCRGRNRVQLGKRKGKVSEDPDKKKRYYFKIPC